MNNIEEIALLKNITVDLNYLKSEGSIALTLKQNSAKWDKDCTLKVETTSSRRKKALSNVKKKTENGLPTKMMRTSLPGTLVAKGGERVIPPLPNLDRFILPKAENVSFWMLSFKLQTSRVLRFIIFM